MSRGKRIAAVVGIAAVAVVVLVALSSRRWIAETLDIWRLRSDDDVFRVAAAERLVEMGSLRAVPYLLQSIERDEREDITVEFLPESKMFVTPIGYALFRLGPTPIPDRRQRSPRVDGILRAIQSAWEGRIRMERYEYQSPR